MLQRLLACLLAVGLFHSAPACATIIFGFSSEGIVFPANPACTDPLAGCQLTAQGTATATAGNISPLPGPWDFTATLALVAPLSPTTFRATGVFSFDDPSAADNDFSGLLEGIFDSTTFTNSMSYEVTAGSGLFAGRTGSGSSLIQVIQQGMNQPFAFVETGSFAIPEPTALALVGLGLFALLLCRSRMRSSARARA
jgi:hypothetical protein